MMFEPKLIEPKVFCDIRGTFTEAFNQKQWDVKFVQDNQSWSYKGVLRGLHFQKNKPQAKLLRVVKGRIRDVIVDMRKTSKTFGQSFKYEMVDNWSLWIPEGFAHGFLVLSNDAIISYKTTDYYDPADERVLLWNDPHLNINWENKTPVLSEKDKLGKTFAELINE
jgi:dTDP-4-dehydrorhamnose 3,5-epimerase